MADDIATLPATRSADHARHGRTLRRIGVVVLSLFLLAGLTGRLGVRTASASDLDGQVDLTVQYGAVTRAGLATPYRVVVSQPGGFAGPIHIAIERGLFDRFDFQNFYPNPSKEAADRRWVRYEFDPPPGDALKWSFDVRTGPNQTLSYHHYRVRVEDDKGRVLAEVKHSMLVVP